MLGMTYEKHLDCPLCKVPGIACGDQSVLAYYHRCENCDTVWLSDRSEYNKVKKNIYKNYGETLDGPDSAKGYHPKRLKHYQRLAERFFV